jgi:hypothetical protein
MEIEYNKLNDDWINNFEKTDKLYQDFYKDDVYYTSLRIIYVNRKNEIEKIKEETFLMTSPNTISREEILEILKKNSYDNDRRYTLLSILKYNFTLETEDIKYFLKSYNDYNFLTVIKNIDAIKFEKSINMLQDLNDIIFLFYEKSTELKKKDPNTITKKIDLSLNNKKKTIKKRYKE